MFHARARLARVFDVLLAQHIAQRLARLPFGGRGQFFLNLTLKSADTGDLGGTQEILHLVLPAAVRFRFFGVAHDILNGAVDGAILAQRLANPFLQLGNSVAERSLDFCKASRLLA